MPGSCRSVRTSLALPATLCRLLTDGTGADEQTPSKHRRGRSCQCRARPSRSRLSTTSRWLKPHRADEYVGIAEHLPRAARRARQIWIRLYGRGACAERVDRRAHGVVAARSSIGQDRVIRGTMIIMGDLPIHRETMPTRRNEQRYVSGQSENQLCGRCITVGGCRL